MQVSGVSMVELEEDEYIEEEAEMKMTLNDFYAAT